MNTISSINSFAWKSQSVSVNSWDYISSKLAKTITFNISGGTNYVSLTNTVSYANTAVGINQVTPNTTFLQCLSGSSFLKTSDVATSSFTFYVKYQMRNASLSTNVWNKQSPVLTFSRSFIGPSQAFTVSFLSTYPVVNVPYTISGIVTGDITNAAISGNLNGYNNTLSYVSSTTSRKTMTFTAGGVTKSVSFLSALYTVTVAGGVFYISTNGGATVQQPKLTFASGGLYVFDQSDATNTGNRLVLGTGVDTGRSDTNVVFNGTPGSANAYTLIDLSGVGTIPSYYFSATTTGMGYSPPPELAYIYYDFTNSSNKGTRGSTYDLYNLVSSTGTILNDGSNPMGGSFLRGIMSSFLGIGIGAYTAVLGLTSPWTICFWVRGTPADMIVFMGFCEETFNLGVKSGGLTVNKNNPTTIPNVFNGEWNFVVLRSNGSHFVYRNSIQSTYSIAVPSLGTKYSRGEQNRLFFRGGAGDTCDLDKFRMFNFGLSDAQVSLLYNYNYTRSGV